MVSRKKKGASKQAETTLPLDKVIESRVRFSETVYTFQADYAAAVGRSWGEHWTGQKESRKEALEVLGEAYAKYSQAWAAAQVAYQRFAGLLCSSGPDQELSGDNAADARRQAQEEYCEAWTVAEAAHQQYVELYQRFEAESGQRNEADGNVFAQVSERRREMHEKYATATADYANDVYTAVGETDLSTLEPSAVQQLGLFVIEAAGISATAPAGTDS